MKHRALALLGLIATLTLVGLLLHERKPAEAPPALALPTPPAEIEASARLAVAEPEGISEGRVEAPPKDIEPPVLRIEEEPTADSSPWLELTGGELTDTVLVFRALDDARQPVHGELTLRTKSASRRNHSSSDESAWPDSEGRFQVTIEPALPSGVRREIEVCARERTLIARVDLSRSFPPGSIDMGDLVLAPSPLVAEGRVVDASGHAVSGAELHAHSWNPLRGGGVELEDGPYYGVATTAVDGAFALYGATRETNVDLVLRHDHLRAPPREVRVGSHGIEIVAVEGGGVAGQLLVDSALPVNSIRITLHPEDVAEGSRMETFDSSGFGSRQKIADDGRFQFEGLLPWRYTFSVAIAQDVLAEIPGIEIVSGAICRDPRLQALDLLGRLNVFTLDLVVPSPSLKLRGAVGYRASGTSSPLRVKFLRGSHLVIVTPLPAIDAIVRASDCRIERLSAVAEQTEVRLRSAIPVRLVLPRGVVLPARPLFVGVRIESPEARRTGELELEVPGPGSMSTFDEHGEALCQACESGPMKVRWFLEHRSRGGSGSGPLDLEQLVEVEDRDGEQRIELAVTQQALDSALAR